MQRYDLTEAAAIARRRRVIGLPRTNSSYRSRNVAPTKNDLMSPPNDLKPHEINAGYGSAEDYLDVQFNLLREDFIRSLRAGVFQVNPALKSQYYDIHSAIRPDMDNNDDSKSGYVYEDLRMIGANLTRDGLTVLVQFNQNNDSYKRIRWKAGKRLIYGSLLCFTDDKFQNTFLFAIVRDSKEVERAGNFEVQFLPESMAEFDGRRSLIGGPYVAVESTAFYEAYYQVLKGLQNVDSHHFPMASYILHQRNSVKVPRYLSLPCFYFTDRHGKVFQSSAASWPSAERLGFNDSQYRAFNSAIKQEFCVIQGPPGTGKTFTSLKIVRWLLLNMYGVGLPGSGASCRSQLNKPILVVCYTNHALDQFLEGILDFCQDDDILRIGSRCKSEKLQKCQMKDKRAPPRKGIGPLKYKIRQEMKSIENLCNQDKMTIGKSRILYHDCPQFVTHNHHLQKLQNISNKLPRSERRDAMYVWLSGWRNGEPFPELYELVPSGAAMLDAADQEENLLEVEGEYEREAESRQLDDLGDDEEEESVKNSISLTIGESGYKDGANVRQKTRRLKLLFWKEIRGELQKTDVMSEREAETCRDLVQLNKSQRWRLYRLWLRNFQSKNSYEMLQHRKQYQELVDQLKELRVDDDIYLMSKAKIVGMTTTAAARYQKVLDKVGPPIVIAEEAAEVLEGHLVASLSRHCQHLILIGDHKQLRPKPNDYELETRYNLGISLFERMVMNGVPYKTLDTQHRMRPEISKYLQHIYSYSLKDSPSVQNREEIRGLSSPVTFFHHTHAESGKASKYNEYEADMIASLTRYLLKQKYEAKDITIISMYSAQLILLRSKMSKQEFMGIKLTTVDNFQGEESTIIILSTVRNNNRNNLGFVKIENRICVCLSRARYGMFVFGNCIMLAAGSALWRKVMVDAQKVGELVTSFKLSCERHGVWRTISTPEELNKASTEVGCTAVCKIELECGHLCARKCHNDDLKHKKVKCNIMRRYKLACGHTIARRCFEGKALISYQCEERVEKAFSCGHVKELSCQERDKAVCNEKCAKTLRCGHSCARLCIQPCLCGQITPKRCLKCSQLTWVKCCEKLICMTKCTSKLACGHQCAGTCTSCTQSGHTVCKEICGQLLDCQIHACEETCGRCTSRCDPRKHQCTTCIRSSPIISWRTSSNLVYNSAQRHSPNMPVRSRLGSQRNCGKLMACGHKCKQALSQCVGLGCAPCAERCLLKCSHDRRCRMRCSDKCKFHISSSANCTYSCPHQGKCTNKCGEKCSIQPCSKVCPESYTCIKCTKPSRCIGICGDVCPQLCLACAKKQVQPDLLATARQEVWIRLVDCGHTIPYYCALERVKSASLKTPGLAHCPVLNCEEQILNTFRFQSSVQKWRDAHST